MLENFENKFECHSDCHCVLYFQDKIINESYNESFVLYLRKALLVSCFPSYDKIAAKIIIKFSIVDIQLRMCLGISFPRTN